MSIQLSNGILIENSFNGIKRIVRIILDSWPSYQFAVKNQLGGSQTTVKVIFLEWGKL